MVSGVFSVKNVTEVVCVYMEISEKYVTCVCIQSYVSIINESWDATCAEKAV